MFERKSFAKHYEGRVDPFKIIGNVYFIGCIPASSHLIDTGEGLILIDTGYEDTLFLLVDSIYRLGFRPSDIKYIIHTHWHGDHTAATAGLVALSGAKTLIGHKDAARHVRALCTLVDQGLHVRLGEYAAAGSDGVGAFSLCSFFVHLRGGNGQQRRHLVNERTGAARAGAVHGYFGSKRTRISRNSGVFK